MAAAAETKEGEEPKKLSKSELNKLKKKEQRSNAKANAKTGEGDEGDAKLEAKKGGENKAPAQKASSSAALKSDIEFSDTPKNVCAMLNKYETILSTNQFINGDSLSASDREAFNELKPNLDHLQAISHPYLFGWYCFVSKLSENIHNTWAAAPAAKGGKKAAPAKKGGKKEVQVKEINLVDDDDMDLFGDDNEEDAKAAEEAKAKIKAEKEGKKKVKKVVIAQSLVMFEVKPLDDTTNLDDLAKRIFKELAMDGAYWKTEYKKEPVAYGIFKLIVAVTIEDDKVSVDNDLVEKLEAMDDMVQSVEIACFSKI